MEGSWAGTMALIMDANVLIDEVRGIMPDDGGGHRGL